MGKGDTIAKKIYMREHSNLFRRRANGKHDEVEEDPVVEINGLAKTIMTILCRNKQRIKQQAWIRWTKNSNVHHDYTSDLRVILSRDIPPDEYRTELEIEVLWKWAVQHSDADPTGLAHSLVLCKRKTVVVSVLQQCRLERICPGDAVIYQGSLPRQEDGHFTVISGEYEVLQLPENSMQLLYLHEYIRQKNWTQIIATLESTQILGSMVFPSGFGELSTLTNTKRTATVRCCPKLVKPGEILVVPKQAILDCLEARRGSGREGSSPSEAVDFLRQSGLAQRISPKDLIAAAQSMIKRTLLRGEIIFCKGEPVESLFLVVSGDIVLDTGDSIEKEGFEPFKNVNYDNCYHMSSGSILGDEGVVGQNKTFASTAAVVSDAAVIFEATGFGMSFLIDRLGGLRYSAIAYRDRSRWSVPLKTAENMNPYSTFNSLRKCIANTHPYRATKVGGEESSPVKKTLKKTTSQNHITNNHSKDGSHIGKHGGHRTHGEHGNQGHGSGRHSHEVSQPPSKGYKEVVDLLTQQVRRMLFGVSMHHAEEAIRVSRKRGEHQIKNYAQESILFDELLKRSNKMSHQEQQEFFETEKKLKKSLAKYRERMAQAQLEKEQQIHMGDAAVAVQLFASFAAAAMDEDDSLNDNNDEPGAIEKALEDINNDATSLQSGVKNDDDSIGSSQMALALDDATQKLTKIERYFLWIDKFKKPRKNTSTMADAVNTNNNNSTTPMPSTSNGIANGNANGANRSPGTSAQTSPMRPGTTESRKSNFSDIENSDKVPNLNLTKVSRPNTHESQRPQTRASTASSSKGNRGNNAANNAATTNNDPLAMTNKGVITTDNAMVNNTNTFTINSNGVITKLLKFHRMEPPNIRRVLPQGSSINFFDKNIADFLSKSASFETMTITELNKIESPQGFFEELQKKEFPIRSKYQPQYEWKTRFMKLNGKLVDNPIKVDDSNKRLVRSKSQLAPLVSMEPMQSNRLVSEDENEQEAETTQNKVKFSDASDKINEISVFDSEMDANSRESYSPQNSGKYHDIMDAVPPPLSRISSELTSDTKESDVACDSESHPHSETSDQIQRHGSLDSGLATPKTLTDSTGDSDGKGKSKASEHDSKASSELEASARPYARTKVLQTLMVETGKLAQVNPPSDALRKFNETLCTDITNRKLIEGRKKANASSRFQLQSSVLPVISDRERSKSDSHSVVSAPSYMDNQSNENGTSLLLLHCLHSTDSLSTVEDLGSQASKSSTFRSVVAPDSSLKHYLTSHFATDDSQTQAKLDKTYNRLVYDSMRFTTEHKKNHGGIADYEISSWQNYSVDISVHEKQGPKATFPVVTSKNITLSEKASRAKRSRRYGSGQLAFLGTAKEEEPIEGPSSYLEVFKKNSKLHLSSKRN